MSDRTIGTKPVALLLVAVVALGAMAGVAAADGELGVTVDDTDGEPTVTVTENDTALQNATVNVTVVDPANESYAGAGEYTTDENGTVGLPAPEENVTVDVTATADNRSASTTVDLEATAEPESELGLDVAIDDGEPVVTVTDGGDAVENASVNVTTADGQNVTYVGEGDYETDENGTVTLPAPDENVTVDVAATVGNDSIAATVDLTVEETEEPVAEEPSSGGPFGQLVRDFIDRIGDREGGIGAAVSDFVRENNPGNAPDDAGAPGGPSDGDENASDDGDADENASDDGDADENASDGPGNAPERAGSGNGNGNANGNGNDGDQGPPENVGPNSDDDADDDGDESDDADDERGPPDHAGPDRDDDSDDDGDESEDADEDDANDDADDADDDADEDDADEDEADEDDADENDADEDDSDGDDSDADDDDGGSSNGNGAGNGNGNGPP